MTSCPLFLTAEWFDTLDLYGLPAHPSRSHLSTADGQHTLLLLRTGHTAHALSSYYSPDYGTVGGSVPKPAEALEITQAFRSSGAQCIELRPLHATAHLLETLPPALRQTGYLCDIYSLNTNWYLPCTDLRWADYLAQRPSRLRNTLRRCQNKLTGTPGFRIDILQQGGEALERAISDYNRVYASSWKEPEPFPNFIPELCRMTASHAWLRMGVLYVENEPAAAQIWFVKDQTASIYKLAYDARFAKLGVGTVLTAALFEQVMDVDKVSEIDFLTGNDDYKAEWMSHKRALIALLAFNTRSIGGLLRAARHFGPRWLKRKLGRT